MIRVNDHVRLDKPIHGREVAQVFHVGEGGNLGVRVEVAGVSYHESVDDGSTTLLCGSIACLYPAECFTSTGRPLCEACSAHEEAPVLAVRPELPRAIVACVCGESLDAGKSEGVWTMGDPPIACEYRTCAHCHSSRAYMAEDTIPGRPVRYFEDAGAVVHDAEWDSLLDAIEATPWPMGELRRGAVVLARAFLGPGAVCGWRLLTPERED